MFCFFPDSNFLIVFMLHGSYFWNLIIVLIPIINRPLNGLFSTFVCGFCSSSCLHNCSVWYFSLKFQFSYLYLWLLWFEPFQVTGDLDKMVALQRTLEPYGICEVGLGNLTHKYCLILRFLMFSLSWAVLEFGSQNRSPT